MSQMADWRRDKTVAGWAMGLLIAAAPFLALATFFALQPITGSSTALRWILFADIIYILVIAALVMGRIARMISARRAQSAGSRLHLRLTAVFATVALVPAVLVALFAMITVNSALEGWFSDNISSAISASQAAAEAYSAEQTTGIEADVRLLASVLNFNQSRSPLDAGELRVALGDLEPQLQRPVKEIFLVDNLGNLLVRGPNSYQFDLETPTPEQIEAAGQGVAVIEDFENGELRGLFRLQAFSNHYLYLGRTLDPDLLELLNETTQTAQVYQRLEADRGRLLFDFGLLYLAFAVILILAATWVGLWFAERLSDPIGRMTAAAQRVGAGDLDARVGAIEGDDEIAMLGRYFNQMTHQLKGQRERLVRTNEQIDRRRRLFDSVLSSITSGVIGVDQDGRVTFINKSAQRALLLEEDVAQLDLAQAVPEFVPLFESLRSNVHDVAQGEVKLTRQGKQEQLLVRIATRENEDKAREGFVIAFEDVTDLVTAQRMAAWGDVARRIAHEVKNPLTPIKLSAERISRKFAPKVGDDSDQLEAMTAVIVRQTDDLRRIVDDFARFARMPEAQKQICNLSELVAGAVILQESAQPKVAFQQTIDAPQALANIDPTLMGQALTNLLKNAGEAIAARADKTDLPKGEIRLHLKETERRLTLTISDNGVGLPADRAKLFEPYVTHRDEGTGLGLSIVLKIIEDHGGSLTLEDAAPCGPNQARGAKAVIILPKAHAEAAQSYVKGARYG